MNKGTRMKLIIVGATGFIGREAVAYFQRKGYEISAFVRNTERAKNTLGGNVHLLGPDTCEENFVQALENANAVINLSGRRLAGVRWNSSNKIDFVDSRVKVTQTLANQISSCKQPPSVLISASAVGYYGNRGRHKSSEISSAGNGFLSNLCVDWEQAAINASESGTRVCLLRLGVVLGLEGGILNLISPQSDMGFVTYPGTGKQYMSWIHMKDVMNIIQLCLDNQNISGPINCVAPLPTTGKEFAKNIQNVTQAKLIFSIPSLILRSVFGEGEKVLTDSQNIAPTKLINEEYDFQYPLLTDALNEEFRLGNVSINKIDGKTGTSFNQNNSVPSHNRGQYELTTQIAVNCKPEKAFSFFSSPLNLGLTTPSWLDFRIMKMPSSMATGTRITYKIRLGIFNFKWISEITRWEPNRCFVDVQEKGPYAYWHHEHQVLDTGNGTSCIKDRVIYEIPGGIVGKLLHKLLIRGALVRIFKYREKILLYQLGAVPIKDDLNGNTH